ncbi:MAG: amidohydrolase family protein [Anaerolineales bacterium]|nr:amidohydrolase family protein [Anaerolineales bacterium]
MIIDAHTHLFPEGVDKVGTAEMLIQEMDELSVDKAVILGIYPRVDCRFILEQAVIHPDRLLGFASVNPNDGEEAVDLLDHCLENYQVYGLKLHPSMQTFSADDADLLEPILRRVEEVHIPVLMHCWGWFGQEGFADPIRIMNLAKGFPEITFIMAHCGGMRFMDLLPLSRSRAMGVLNNLYVDLSIILFDLIDSPLWPFLRWTLKTIGLDRVMMGSDFPDFALSDTINLTEKLGFEDAEMREIMGGNAARLYGITA